MPTKVTSLYIPEIKQKLALRIQEADWPLWKDFLQIAKREGQSPGSIIYKEMLKYVRLHSPGNPQQRLDVLNVLGKPYRAPLTCACGRPATRKVTMKDKTIRHCCSDHMPKNDVDFWRYLPEQVFSPNLYGSPGHEPESRVEETKEGMP